MRFWPRRKKRHLVAGQEPRYDERVFGRNYQGPAPWVIGLVIVVIIAMGSFLAYTKHIPFTGYGYQLHATFENAADLKPNSPVRIAGVNVGKVQSVEADGDLSRVTFNVEDVGLPIHDDAEVTIRPRLFLEGNFFVDLRPGSPSAPTLSSGSTIPTTQTAVAVQLDQVLTSLQQPTRTSLRRLLSSYGTALTYVAPPGTEQSQDPDVQGESAAQAINQTFRYGGAAGRDTSIVNQAFLGEHTHDLSKLILAQRNFFTQLASDETSLSDLVTNFNTTMGALANQSQNLSASIHELAPTLEEAQPALRNISDSLPPLRALARASEPGISQLPATIRVGSPWLVQTGKLLRYQELGADAKFLDQAAPGLAQTTHNSLKLFPQTSLLSRCVSHNLVPTGNEVVDNAGGSYPFATGQPNFREFFYGAVNLAGESQYFDGNGPMVRFQTGGGPKLVKMANPNGGFHNESLWANNISDPLGTRPRLPVSGMPPFRMDVPCHTQDVPDINGPAAAVGPPSPETAP